MCLKESRWRRFTADSVTEIYYRSEWRHEMAARFWKIWVVTTARCRELGLFFGLRGRRALHFAASWLDTF